MTGRTQRRVRDGAAFARRIGIVRLASVGIAGVCLVAATGCREERPTGEVLSRGREIAFLPLRMISLFEGKIASVTESDGRLIVLAHEPRSLQVVARDDSVARPLSRTGDGPGEWRSPVAMTAIPNGSVIVFEDRHYRFLRIVGPDSILTIARAEAFPRGVRPVGALGEDVLIGLMDDTPHPEPGMQVMTRALVLVSATMGTRADTIGIVATGRGSLVRVGNGPSSMWFPSPFHPGDAYWVLPDSSAIVITGDGAVARVRGSRRIEHGNLALPVALLLPGDLDTASGYLDARLREHLLGTDTLPSIAGPLHRCSSTSAVIQLRRRSLDEPAALLLSTFGVSGVELAVSHLRYPIHGRVVGCSRTDIYLARPGRNEGTEDLLVLSPAS